MREPDVVVEHHPSSVPRKDPEAHGRSAWRSRATSCELISGARLAHWPVKAIHGETARKRLRALFNSPSRPLPRQATAAAGGVTTCTRERHSGASVSVGSGSFIESSSRCR